MASRRLLVALAVPLLLAAFAAWAWAADGAAASGALDNDALEELLGRDPLTSVALVLSRFVPVGIGVALLILWYLRRDRIRGGLLPPPPVAVTTRPFGVLNALLLVVGALVVVPAVVLIVLGSGEGWDTAEKIPLWAKIVAVGLGSLPAASFVAWRRLRLARGAPAGRGAAAGSPAPGLVRALGLGGWTLCVSALLVVPAALVWALALQGIHKGAEVQDLVQQMVRPAGPYDPWIIAVFGVFVAPFAEESIFRGMLYPAAKQAFGGDRRATWLAAIVVSLIFAGIHESWLALVPLFVLAMVLTWVFETTNSLAAVVCAHALHNFLSLVPLLLLGSRA